MTWLLSILGKIDLKTGLGLAVVLVLSAWLGLEKIRHGDTRNDRDHWQDKYKTELADRLYAEALSSEWRIQAMRCSNEVDALRRIAKTEQEAWQRRVAKLKQELNSIPTITAKEGDYGPKDLLRDVTRWNK